MRWMPLMILNERTRHIKDVLCFSCVDEQEQADLSHALQVRMLVTL